MKTFRPDIKTKRQLKDAAFKAACDNHMWISAFALIRPTDETLKAIGQHVVDQLKRRDELLPSYTEGDANDPIHDLSRLTPMLYCSFNAS